MVTDDPGVEALGSISILNNFPDLPPEKLKPPNGAPDV
jgi:hypothetical protein